MAEDSTQPASSSEGGRGSLTLRDLMDPHRARGTLGMLATALRNGYIDIFGIEYQETKRLVRELALNGDDDRTRAAALKLQVEMAKHDLKLMEILDKSDRLDHDLPTENVKTQPMRVVFDDAG